MIGARLGNWVIDKELGQGGMGRVYLAHEEPGLRQAAVKVLATELSQNPGFQQRFQREIEALQRLDHPGIVHFYEAGEQEGRFFYVMEYVDGQTYDELLLEHGRLPWLDVLELGLQVAPALKHAHDRGVIHRDIKPSNLLRTPGGTVKITDFGIAHVFSSTPLTLSGVIVGTGEFLSPEQAEGKPVTKRSDLYSLGVVLYTLLTGRPPFQGESLLDLLHKHRYGQFDLPQRIVPEIPTELADIVCQLLEKDPAQRPGDGMVLQKRLNRVRRRIEFENANTREMSADDSEEDIALLPRERRLRKPGPATVVSRLMREDLEEQKRGGRLSRIFNQPWVLGTLLILAIAGIVWGFWPASAEKLFQRGAALMRSEDPEDWETAWDDPLKKLENKYPDHPYKEEVEEFRRQLDEHRAQRKAKRAGVSTSLSEAQWFYWQGLRLRDLGDEAGARRMWESLIQAFGSVPSEQVWVQQAEEQLRKKPPAEGKARWASVLPALDRARELRDQGKQAEAEAIWKGFEELYKNDPSAGEILARIKQDRQK